MNQIKRLFSFLLLGLMPVVTLMAYDINGSVVDETGEPLSDATARLLAAKDSAYVKGVAADLDGKFSITGINKGRYILETTYLGYNTAHTNVTVADKNVTLNPIKMTQSSHLLDEAVITAVKTPIKVMEDTVEYNADSYKTQPNAVVEDLLKRLPGVEVDSDGKITANGKEVKKILIDGKEFFSDDPQIASKNLPVNMVDKLQVVDRKSDLARMTGVDDGEDETVINLTVKKGMKNGWFGATEAAYGTDDRYLGTFNINRFWDGNQVTLLGNFNNINRPGFTDSNGNSFRRFGGDQGINESQALGINFNVGNDEILRIGGDVMYSHSDRTVHRRQNREYMLGEDSYDENTLSDSEGNSHRVESSFRVEWKPDSFNTLDFRPNFNFSKNDAVSDQFAVATGKNTSLNKADSDGKAYNLGGRLIYNHNFSQRRGRSFSVFANYRVSNTREYENSYVYNIFHQFNDSLDYYDQYIDNHTWSNSVNGRLSWTEPIGDVKNGNFVTVAYSASMSWSNADKIVYDRDIAFDGNRYYDYEVNGVSYRIPVPIIDYASPQPVDSLSNRFRNTNFRQDIRFGYRKVTSKLNLDAGMSFVPTRTESNDLINPAKNIPARWVWNYAPYVRFRYRFSKTASVNIDYNGRSSQPSMSQLQPVADYSNPLNIVQGNPNLLPSFSHNVRLRYQNFDMESQRSIMLMVDGSMTQNAIINKIDFNTQTGGRYTTYENVNGVGSANIMNMYSQPLGHNKLFTINNFIRAAYNRQVGYSQVGRDASGRNVSQNITVMESLGFAFRPDNLELELRPNYSFNTTRNSIKSLSSTSVHRYGGSFNATYYTPIDIVLQSELNFNATRGYAAGYNEDTWMWNASISYMFLKDKNATLSLKAYDLLQQKKDISRTVTASYIDNTQFNALTRYFMVSFAYKFNSFGKGNTPEQRGGWGGPGGPGRRPGGPGPR